MRLWAIAGTAGFVLYVILTTPYQLPLWPYSDALGFSIVQMANRDLAFDDRDVTWLLVVVLIISIAVLVVPRWLRNPRAGLWIAGVAASLVLAWNVSGEISASNGTNNFSQVLLGNFPSPPNWLDKATGQKPTIYLGQRITDPQGIWLMEFWNRSLSYVWSLDATAPGPGTTPPGYLTPDTAPDGRLIGRTIEHGAPPGVDYIVADQSIQVAGQFVLQPEVRHVITEDEFGFPTHKVVVQPSPWRLLKIAQPLRLQSSPVGIYADGWQGDFSAYNQFSTPGGKPGWIRIVVSRVAFQGPDKKAGQRDDQRRPADPGRGQGAGARPRPPDAPLGRAQRQAAACSTSGATPPTRVEVRIKPTFSPHEFGNSSDRRQLGAQVFYSFTSKPPPGR